MALVVENGTGVAGANTYIDDAFFTDYADARGATYPATAPEREVLIIKAKDYLESFRNKYVGYKAARTNPLQWPRIEVYLDTYPFPSNEIPVELKEAQAQAALEVQTQELQQNTGKDVRREKVDVIEVEYANGGALTQTKFEKVYSLLKPLFGEQFAQVIPVR